MSTIHPKDALFAGEKPFPIIPACEHFAGSEKLITKALELQNQKGGVFDITMDLEDGAKEGHEVEQAELYVRLQNSELNKHRMSGIRVHDYTNKHWRDDVDVIVPAIGDLTAYITIPKPTAGSQVKEMIGYIRDTAKKAGIKREIPIHVLIETHGALHDIREIASQPWMQLLDFGLMDFVSAHHGAIPAAAMRSPGQFSHALIVRAKCEIAAAALGNGVVPSHNVTTEIRDVNVVREDARRARQELGFLRMWSIHPAQILPIVEAMRPDFAEVNEAAAILIAAQDAAWGPIQQEGKLHDRASYRYYWELLQRAQATGMDIPADARQRFFS